MTVVFPLARTGAESRDADVIVVIVRHRTGAPSDARFVRRIEASDAEYADRSARWRVSSESWRLMTFCAADAIR